eukprot:10636375-Alexandrium_andersonii.AAC.1
MAKLIVAAGRELFGYSRVPRQRLRGMATSSQTLQASDFGRRDRGTSGDHLERTPLQGRELRAGSS